MSDALPVLDMHKARDPATRAQTARDMVEALRTVGFLYIDNADGLDFQVMEQMARWFFALPQDQKDDTARYQWNNKSKNFYRGYFPVQSFEVSHKEGFEMADKFDPALETKDVSQIHPFFKEATLWPERAAGVEKFKEDMHRHFDVFYQLGVDVLRLLALGCGMEEHWFDAMFSPNSLSTLRLMHYPPRQEALPPAAIESDGVAVCTGDHCDSGFVTLLATFHFTGLQVLNEQGKWMDVPPRPKSLVMNIGDNLSNMTNGKLKATRHRVKETHVERFTVPFFIEPRHDAEVSRTMPAFETEEQRGKTQEKVEYGPWLLVKLKRYAEYRDMLSLFETRDNAKA